MQGLISGMVSAVDYVVVDTPPLGEVSDALVLLDEINDVLLVSRLGNTRRMSLEIAGDLLDRADRQPAGYVVVGGRNTAGRYPYGAG
jgi:Mrp family chromosome partitioning ATPase